MTRALVLLLAWSATPAMAADASAHPDETPGAFFFVSGVADPVGVEAKLYDLRMDLQRAHVVSIGRSEGGRRGVRCTRIAGPESDVNATGEACAALATRWSGPIRLFLAPRASPHVTPAIVIVEDDPVLGSLVALAPGDSVEVREVRRNGRIVRRSIRLLHGGEALEFRSEATQESVCAGRARSAEPSCASVARTRG